METPSQQESLLLSALTEVLAQAWESGSPVAGQTGESRERVASIALRRMRSFGRRGVKPQDHRRQVTDLAKGLVAQFEREPKLVGPLIKDYEYIAERLLEAFRTHARRIDA